MKAQTLPNYPELVLLVRKVLEVVFGTHEESFSNDGLENNTMIGSQFDFDEWNDKFDLFCKNLLSVEVSVDFCDSIDDILENHLPIWERLLTEDHKDILL